MTKNEILKKVKEYDFAHRGLYNNIDCPENSLKAFKKAVQNGFAIELDVHLTKDNRLVVVHDSSLKRMSNVDLNIEDLIFEESRKYKLLDTDELMPEFKEVLTLVDEKVPLLIELKVVKNTKELCEKVMDELKDYNGLYVIESFYPFALKYLYENYKDIVIGQLSGDLLKDGKSKDAEVTPIENILMKNLIVNIFSHPDFVAFQYEDINLRSFKKFKGAKFSWTIRTYEDYLVCKEKGITPIFERFNPKEK